MTKAPHPSVSKGVGAFVVAVTVGFEPLSQTNGRWVDRRDPRDSAEVGHMCAHPKTVFRRNSVTAALPLARLERPYRYPPDESSSIAAKDSGGSIAEYTS